MLVLRGKKIIKQIFLDQWEGFVAAHPDLIRSAIHTNVDKMLVCGSEEAGFHLYQCPACGGQKKVPHSCKSRFCASCGVKQTDIWIERYSTLFADCEYQHLTFSIPEQFRIFFRVGRSLFFNALYDAVNQTLRDWYSLNGYLPGAMDVLHTFGRGINFHVHIHVLITCGGLDSSHTKWIPCQFLPHAFLKQHFKLNFIANIRRCWKQLDAKGLAGISDKWQHIFAPVYREAIITQLQEVIWYVHIGERLKNAEFVVRYIGRYTKRPAIAESRIAAYDGTSVTFSYQDHRTHNLVTTTIPVFEFIGRLISHIPDRNFRIIRYTGFYANRVRGTLLPQVFAILKQDYETAIAKLASLASWWREKIQQLTKLDPLTCALCLVPLSLVSVVYATNRKDTS